ncbi:MULTISPECIES: hypothetical protein [unclassified Variovorax]|uniref:hypothetical protein n=1 Tax=unclassified Variovorax TaxID=663243 RepID=UPI003F45723C
MNPPETIGTDPCDIHPIDTSSPSGVRAVDERGNADLVALLSDAMNRITSDAPRQVGGKLLSPLDNPLYGPLLRRLDEAILTLACAHKPALFLSHEFARALDIADESMFNVLSSNCVPGDESRTVLGLVSATGSEVKKLGEADPEILEAFDWLRLRGFVKFATDGLGDHIIVVRRPGEE